MRARFHPDDTRLERENAQHGIGLEGGLDRQRFERLYPNTVARSTKVLLVGCGGIGSYTAAILARMGIGSITLVDFDRVEDTNVATQDLPVGYIGLLKVEAIEGCIFSINPNVDVTLYSTHFAPRHLSKDQILIAAVDSIKVRQEIYKVFEAQASPGQILIDPRMGAESFELWVIRRGSEFEQEYKRSLFDPTPRAELPCGARAIAYTGAFAGAITASAVRRVMMEPTWETWVVGDVGTMRMQVLREIK